jgi:cellulose synthase/poly-beta-1,6-N-acetylglucosamine synthase-like glycosyltransferase
MEQVERKSVTHFMAGLIIAAILIVYSMFLTFMDLTANQSLSYLSMVFLMLGIIFFVNQYGKSVDHTATFGQLFSFGFKATAIATLVVIAFQIIFFFIFPEYKEKIIDISREQMLKQGNVPEAQVEQALEMVRKFFWVGLIGMSLFINMVSGAIASLIGAGITKKIPQSPFQQQS